MAKLLKAKVFLHKLRVFGVEKISFYLDRMLFMLRAPVKKSKGAPKTLLFVGEQLPPRIPRMAKWIKAQSDYSITLLCHKRGFVEKFSDPCFDEVFLFRNEWHLKRILRSLQNVELVHGFAPKSYFPNVARRFMNKPYVHDMQDVYTIYYTQGTDLRWLQKELPHEAECLAQADGIVANSMEINVALRRLNVKQKPGTIFFPLYCDDAFFRENKKDITNGEIHLVYAGGVAGSFRNPAQYGNIQFRNLISLLTSQGLHFHIYPSPSNIRADYEEYEKIAKENSYFHFHAPIAQQELSKELNKYHFGLLPFFKDLSEQSDLKLKYATTLKLFNYLEAGIPMAVSPDIIYQNWIAKRYGAGVDLIQADLGQLKKRLEAMEYKVLRENAEKARNLLSLRGNTRRLLAFYSDLLDSRKEAL
jgi:hypothetical protein